MLYMALLRSAKAALRLAYYKHVPPPEGETAIAIVVTMLVAD